MNFLDPQETDKGEPWGPHRYKEIVQERYYLAKHGKISYQDTGKMTPTERDLIKQFILEDAQKERQLLEDVRQQRGKK